MVTVSIINSSLYNRSSDQSILEECLIFGVPGKMTKNRKLYYYKFNITDVVEINFFGNNIVITEFIHSPAGISTAVASNISFLEGYFISAGVKDNRFLYDTSMKTIVRFSDFVEEKNVLEKTRTLGFIPDNSFEGYVTSPHHVEVFKDGGTLTYINNALLAIYNNVACFTKPKDNSYLDGLPFVAYLMAKMGGMNKERIKELTKELVDKTGIDLNYKIEKKVFKTEPIDILIKELNTNKLRSCVSFLALPEKQKSNIEIDADVDISYVFDKGLDNVLKSLADPNRKITVHLDFPVGLKFMYLMHGIAYVGLEDGMTSGEVEDMFDSNNIQPVFS